MDRISAVLQKFTDHNIKGNREWVDGCISWFLAEDPTLSLDRLYTRTHDQWLLGDLTEVSEPCLPDALFAERKESYELNGNYALQLNFVLDISESPYDQLRILHNRILDATDEEKIEQRQNVKKNRMLRLELTDGHRTIVAMEHKPISILSTKLVPGCKVLLRGPIKCVNKVLFLVPGTIEILGGELDTLLTINAYENVLLRKLNKPTKDNPIRDYSEPTVVENRNSTLQQRSLNNSRPANFSTQAAEVDPFDDPMDDDLLMTAALERVEEVERKNSQTDAAIFPTPPAQLSGSSAQEDRMRELLPDFHDFIDTSMLLHDEDDDAFDVAAIEMAMTRTGEIFSQSYEFQYESSHLATIEQIQAKEIQEFTGKTMIIRAKFEAVVDKLRFVGESGNQATMSILVQDSWSRGKLRVQISTSVMDSLLIYDSKELKEMFKNIQKHPQTKGEIQVALDDLKQKIHNLKSFIRINYSDGFVLLEIMQQNPQLDALFTSKIKKERLVVVTK